MNDRKRRIMRDLWERQAERMRRAARRNALKSGAWSTERRALEGALDAAGDMAVAIEERAKGRR